MEPNLEITAHFMRAFYYYILDNKIWHIHFKKVRTFVQNMVINKTTWSEITFDPDVYCDPYVGGIGAAYRRLQGHDPPIER